MQTLALCRVCWVRLSVRVPWRACSLALFLLCAGRQPPQVAPNAGLGVCRVFELFCLFCFWPCLPCLAGFSCQLLSSTHCSVLSRRCRWRCNVEMSDALAADVLVVLLGS